MILRVIIKNTSSAASIAVQLQSDSSLIRLAASAMAWFGALGYEG